MFRINNGLIVISSLIGLFFNAASSTITSSDFDKYLSHNESYNINNNEHEDLKDDTINFNVIARPQFNLTVTDITATSFQLHWKPPFVKVEGFLIQIIELGFNYSIPSMSCIFPTKPPREINVTDYHTIRYTIHDILPNQNIKVQMAYYNDSGPWSIPINFTTLPKESDSVTNIDVKFSEDKGIVIWKQPCFSNGNIKQFNLIAKGEHVPKTPLFPTDLIKANLSVAQMQDEYRLEIHLKAEYLYELSIQTFIKEIDNSSAYGVYKFTSPPQIPPEPPISSKLSPECHSSSVALIQLFTFEKWGDENGEILYYSIMIGETGYISNTSGWINSTTDWPQEKTWKQVHEEDPIKEYQVTDIRWNPFTGTNKDNPYLRFPIGNDSNCRNEESYCNGPLRASTEYGVILRAFTSRGYRDSQVFSFTTAKLDNTYFIISTTAIVAAIGSVLAFSYTLVIKRRKKWQMQRKKQNKLNIDLDITADIGNSSEPENLQLLNVDAINEEYKKLEKNTKKIHHHIIVGSNECNKEKNRYCNILPYDYNRVTLCGSDSGYYINASYIDGLGGVNNFIATQGPKENTAVDFWKMISSHNITIIIMLCKTVEQKKIKCDVYYPEAGMSIMYGDLCVYCIQRQPNKSYIVRDLILYKDGQKLYISHFQYLEWPDFGAPSSVKTFMKFCNLITKAEDPSNNSNPLAVHCSAGCGRTGTFIAIYHMLKMKPADVDIYEIVYKLRDKKMGMVQTREQYVFLYKCLIYLKKTRIN